MIETQKTVSDWMYATFPGTDPESPRKCLRALEEMVELCVAAGAASGEVMLTVSTALSGCGMHFADTTRPNLTKVPEEAADVVIVLYGVAQMKGFDLHAEIDKKMAVNRSRTWAVRGDGTGYHVKPEGSK
jgi:hypothetical protein